MVAVLFLLDAHRLPHQGGHPSIQRPANRIPGLPLHCRSVDAFRFPVLVRVEGSEVHDVVHLLERSVPPVEIVVHHGTTPRLHLEVEGVSENALQPCHRPFRLADRTQQGTEGGTERGTDVRFCGRDVDRNVHRLVRSRIRVLGCLDHYDSENDRGHDAHQIGHRQPSPSPPLTRSIDGEQPLHPAQERTPRGRRG